MLDPRVGRWFAPDALEKKFPSLTTYNFVANNPIICIDEDGNELIYMVLNKKREIVQKLVYKNGNFYHTDMQTGKILRRYNPGKESVSKDLYKLLSVYREIEKSGDKVLIHKLKTLENSSRKHYITNKKETDFEMSNYVQPATITGLPSNFESVKASNGEKVGTITVLDFSMSEKQDFANRYGIEQSNSTLVTHEMQHSYDYDIGNMVDNTDNNDNNDPPEVRAVINENRMREIKRYKKRTGYESDKPIDKKFYKKNEKQNEDIEKNK